MEPSEELKKWVAVLSTAEKRFVKLQGKARAGSGSQLLELFDWLNQADPQESVPSKAKFAANLPTLAVRLRSLMLDSLRLLHKEDNTAAGLRTMIDEIALLQSKKLHHVAARLLRKAKTTAAQSSQYPFLLLCIENELQAVTQLPPEQAAEQLQLLREEELAVLAKQQILRELQHRHNSLLLIAKQFPFSLQPDIIEQVRQLAETDIVSRYEKTGPYLERALVVNILGIRDLFIRDPDPAVLRYQRLIREWAQHPEWLSDQSSLLLVICKYYLNVCLFSPVDHEKTNADLAILHQAGSLPQNEAVLFRELLYSNQFAIALNLANFDLLHPMIKEIDQWMTDKAGLLSQSQVFPFLCNFAVAEFLAGNFAAANKWVTRILNSPNRKVRVDIREFAIVLQTVLHFQLNNSELNESLTRAGKRHFSKNKIATNFELLILRHIELLMRCETQKEKEKLFDELICALEKLSETLPDTIPLLGLNEIHMWAEFCKTGVPLKEIFTARVKKNLQMLEQREKLE